MLLLFFYDSASIETFGCLRHLFLLIFNVAIDGYAYDQFIKSCVNGHNIDIYADKSIAECKALCSARLDCLAFEYGVPYGGLLTGIYNPKDCQLQDSADKSGCDGMSLNLDLYVKLGMLWCRI